MLKTLAKVYKDKGEKYHIVFDPSQNDPDKENDFLDKLKEAQEKTIDILLSRPLFKNQVKISDEKIHMVPEG